MCEMLISCPVYRMCYAWWFITSGLFAWRLCLRFALGGQVKAAHDLAILLVYLQPKKTGLPTDLRLSTQATMSARCCGQPPDSALGTQRDHLCHDVDSQHFLLLWLRPRWQVL